MTPFAWEQPNRRPPDLGPVFARALERAEQWLADQWLAEQRHLFELDGMNNGSLASVCEQLLCHNLQV